MQLCISVVEGDQVVFLPHSSVMVSLPVSKGAFAMDEVSLKPSLNHLSIRQNQPTCTLFAILSEFPLITNPVVLHFVKVSTVERTF